MQAPAKQDTKVEITTIRPWLYVEFEMAGQEVLGIAERREIEPGEQLTVSRQQALELIHGGKAVAGKHKLDALRAEGIAPPARAPKVPGGPAATEDARIARIVQAVLEGMGVKPAQPKGA